MELISLIIAVASFICSICTYFASLRRERRQATLDAYRELQTQVLDKLNCYTPKQVKEIAEDPRSAQYKTLSALLARCQHFAVGVNTGVYDFKVLQRLAGGYFVWLYRKLEPLIQKKRTGHSDKHYSEFEQFVRKLEADYNARKKQAPHEEEAA